jgi:aminoglycoside phosphotransferase
MPVIVVALEGATANAYFSLAWMVALPLFAVSASTGASLVVTASADEARLPTYARRVLIQTAAIVIPSALVLAVAASQVLTLFGDKYASHSATTLTLLALSAIPNVVNALSVSVYRVQRRMSRVVMLLGFQCGLALVLGIVLLEVIGIAGIGLAWLIAQSLVAVAVMVAEPHTLLGPPGTGGLGMAVRNWAANLGVLGLLLRLRRGPANLRRARAARHLAPKIVASIPQGLNGDQPATWTPHRFLPTVSDVAVITVGPSGRAPQAVIKLPTSSSARGTLRREADVLAALNADPRLDDWRDVLPTVLAAGQVDDQPFLVQRMVPGVAASEMLGSAGVASRAVLTAAAVEIRGLHERTAVSAVVGPAALERWVNGPASLVHHVSAALVGRNTAKLAADRLSDELSGTLEGRRLPLSWIHGDYVPGNILVSPRDTSVVGIIDWELAGAADPPLLDVVSLLVTARAQRSHEELGQVVREYVTGAPWTEYEQDLIEAASLQRPGVGIDARTAVLLWWLRHVSGNLTKSTRYARSRLWARVCVWAVLDLFGPE